MVLKLKSINELVNSVGVKGLIYGKTGAGKTRLALTCDNPLIISLEKGLLSLKGSGILAEPISSMSDMESFLTLLENEKELHRQHPTIFVDSISELAEMYFRQLVAEESHKSKPNQYAPYSTMANKISEITRRMRDWSNVNIIFLAKEEYDKDEGFMPWFPGKNLAQMDKSAPYQLDFVLRLQTMMISDAAGGEKEVTVFKTFTDAESVGKDRSGTLRKYEQPNLTKIFNKMKGL